MDNTKARLRSTQLTGRTLWFDGDSSYDPANLSVAIRTRDVQYVDYMTDLVRQYNANVPKHREIRVKQSCAPLSYEWILPEEYCSLNVIEYVIYKHVEIVDAGLEQGTMSVDEAEEREMRIAEELILYKQRGLLPILRAVIYIINTLSAQNVVWGVGRGSSVSSYVLYVIGVHDVDSFLYDLDVADFLT